MNKQKLQKQLSFIFGAVLTLCMAVSFMPLSAVQAEESQTVPQEEIESSDTSSAAASSDSSTSAQPAVSTDGLTADLGSLTLEVVPATDQDKEKLEALKEEHGDLHLSVQANQISSDSSDTSQDVVLKEMKYTMQLADQNETPVDASDVDLKGTITYKPSQIQDAVDQTSDTQMPGAAVNLETVVHTDGQDKQTDTQTYVEGEKLEPFDFAVNPDFSVSYKETVNNPNFIVQYYVNYPVIQPVKSGDSINMIDSSANGYGQSGNNGKGGNLPTNVSADQTKSVKFGLQSAGNGNYTLKTEMDEIPFYNDETFTYFTAPNPHYFNKLMNNGNFRLVKIKTQAAGETKTWNEYTNLDKTYFTNNQEYYDKHKNDPNITVILVQENMKIRLVYDQTDGNNDISATMYDYDVTEGKNSAGQYVTSSGGSGTYGKWGTGYGINSNTNYSGSGAKLAFGNDNAGTHLGRVTWPQNGNTFNPKGNLINTYNRPNNTFGGCTFNMAESMKNGTIQYSEGLSVPKLFNDGNAKGKTTYSDSSLNFLRSGDTYILNSAKVAGNNQSSSVGNLQYFNHPGKYSIWTNNFWPMDNIQNKDPKFGKSRPAYLGWDWSKDLNSTYLPLGGNVTAQLYQGNPNKSGNFPAFDDGKNHNQLFGMNYEVDFQLTDDYVGPLDYIFYGDDDMWVFLDGKPVVDIGGVHSSVGQYVNLWDYIPHGDTNPHKLNFFYTERGWSGSSCYMRFTLPSVSVVQPEANTGNLQLEKISEGMDADKEYNFFIKLTDANGNELPDEYAYTKYTSDGQPIQDSTDIILRDGSSFTLKSGQYMQVDYLPIGAKFTITETDSQGATKIESGTVGTDGTYNTGQTVIPKDDAQTQPSVTGSIQQGVTVRYFFKNSIPTNEITIGKQVGAVNDQLPIGGVDDLSYTFRLIKVDGTLLFPAQTAYTIQTGDTDPVSAVLNENGLISLKNNQTASFTNSYLAADTSYIVQELIPEDLYKKGIYKDPTYGDQPLTKLDTPVTIDGVTYVVFESEVQSTAAEDSDTKPSGGQHIFTNTLDPEKYGSLHIEKKMENGMENPDAEFSFLVTINDSPLPEGTEYTVDGESKEAGAYGLITLKAGQSANIPNILDGSTFKVQETDIPEGYTQISLDPSEGTVAAGTAVVVTVTNTTEGIPVQLKKLDPDGNLIAQEVEFTLYSSLEDTSKDTIVYPEGENQKTYYLVNTLSFSQQTSIDDLKPGVTYLLKETKAPAGYYALDEPVLFKINQQGRIELITENDNVQADNDSMTISITDRQIDNLPDAGGSGSRWIQMGGLGILAAAAIFAACKKGKRYA